MSYQTDTVVIGAGQAGIAMSRCLTGFGIDHVVLDRGAVASRWRTDRWASLSLLTPNWMTRLPGFEYAGPDPRGFMHKDQVMVMLRRYARSFAAPVREFTDVISVSLRDAGFQIVTDGPRYHARAVVLATGACDTPNVPAWAADVLPSIMQVTTNAYVHPGQLEESGVLVVGGSATGVQLAEEIHRSGRPVTLACGSHVCLPRRYRGRDIMRWMDLCGILSEARDPAVPASRAMQQPSLQLVGGRRPRDIGLESLTRLGVRCVSRVLGGEGQRLTLSADLGRQMERAGERCARLLGRIDAGFRAIDPVVITAWAMTGGALAIAPAAIAREGLPGIPDLEVALTLAVLGFGLTSAAFLIMFSMLSRVGATNLSLVTFVAPVSAMAIGAVFLGEEIGAGHISGAFLILLGLLCIDGRAVRALKDTMGHAQTT